MTTTLLIILFVLLIGIFACATKGAAWLFHRTIISWKHSFICSASLHFLIYVALHLVSTVGIDLSRGESATLGLVLQLTWCTWFFTKHAKSTNGEPLGLSGGAKLSVAVFALELTVLVVPQLAGKII